MIFNHPGAFSLSNPRPRYSERVPSTTPPTSTLTHSHRLSVGGSEGAIWSPGIKLDTALGHSVDSRPYILPPYPRNISSLSTSRAGQLARSLSPDMGPYLPAVAISDRNYDSIPPAPAAAQSDRNNNYTNSRRKLRRSSYQFAMEQLALLDGIEERGEDRGRNLGLTLDLPNSASRTGVNNQHRVENNSRGDQELQNASIRDRADVQVYEEEPQTPTPSSNSRRISTMW